MSTLIESGSPPRSRNLVYTSAGDASNVAQWVAGNPAFDLWITYYGDRDVPDLPAARFLDRRKGSKFQNLYHAWLAWRDRFEAYDRIFLLDDDIQLGTDEINRLFGHSEELELTVLQPAFDPRGKVSHGLTQVRAGSRYRIVNFIEVGVALFRADRLWTFLEEYDPRLSCYGVDWWYAEFFDMTNTDQAAVIDEIIALNPYDQAKPEGREIDKVMSPDERVARWDEIRQKHGLRGSALGHRVRHREPLTGWAGFRSFLRVVRLHSLALPRRLAQRISHRHPAAHAVLDRLYRRLFARV